MILFPKEKAKIFRNFDTMVKNFSKIDNAIGAIRDSIQENYKKCMDQIALRNRSAVQKIQALEARLSLVESYLKDEENFEDWIKREADKAEAEEQKRLEKI